MAQPYRHYNPYHSAPSSGTPTAPRSAPAPVAPASQAPPPQKMEDEAEEIRIVLSGLPDDQGVNEEAVEELFTSLSCEASAQLLYSATGQSLGHALVTLYSYESVKVAVDALHGKVLDGGATRIGIHLLLSPSSTLPAGLAASLNLSLPRATPSPTLPTFPTNSSIFSNLSNPGPSPRPTPAELRAQAAATAQQQAIAQSQATAAATAKLTYQEYLALPQNFIPRPSPARSGPGSFGAPPAAPAAIPTAPRPRAPAVQNGTKRPATGKSLLSRIDIGLKDRMGGFVPSDYPVGPGKGKAVGVFAPGGLQGQTPAQQNTLIELQRARLQAAKSASLPYAKSKAQHLQSRLAAAPAARPVPTRTASAAKAPAPVKKVVEKKKVPTQEELDEELRMLNRARRWGGGDRGEEMDMS